MALIRRPRTAFGPAALASAAVQALLAAAILNGAPAATEPSSRLYACGITSRGYVVGARLPLSGLMHRGPDGSWQLVGFNNPEIQGIDYNPRNPRIFYLAAGNGCVRSEDSGHTWRITTPWDMTELRAVSVDANQPDHVWVALPDGIGSTRDGGRTWTRRDSGIRRKYTQTLRVDRTRAGRVFAGTEQGIFITEDDGASWRLAGAEGAMVTHVAQSPFETLLWLATTNRHGAFRSRDNGATWERIPGIGTERTLYKASFDAAGRMAICGFDVGVLVSEDGGATWEGRNQGLPSRAVWSASFDPRQPGRLLAGVHEEAAYESGDAGRTWKRAGLEGFVAYDFAFVPEARQ